MKCFAGADTALSDARSKTRWRHPNSNFFSRLLSFSFFFFFSFARTPSSHSPTPRMVFVACHRGDCAWGRGCHPSAVPHVPAVCIRNHLRDHVKHLRTKTHTRARARHVPTHWPLFPPFPPSLLAYPTARLPAFLLACTLSFCCWLYLLRDVMQRQKDNRHQTATAMAHGLNPASNSFTHHHITTSPHHQIAIGAGPASPAGRRRAAPAPANPISGLFF